MSVKLSARGVMKLYFAQNGRCEYCRRIFSSCFLPTADHIIPRNNPSTTNNISNIALACEECNVAKGDLSYREFIYGK